MLLGIIMSIFIMQGPVEMLPHIVFDTNTLLYAGAFIIVGYQALSFGVFTRTYAVQAGFLPEKDSLAKASNIFSMELGLIIGLIILLAGVGGTFYSLSLWEAKDFGPLEYSEILRKVIPSVIAIILGLQTILSSFFLSVLQVNKK
jgi:hypothetical protein